MLRSVRIFSCSTGDKPLKSTTSLIYIPADGASIFDVSAYAEVGIIWDIANNAVLAPVSLRNSLRVISFIFILLEVY